jgi:hypothetical protein
MPARAGNESTKDSTGAPKLNTSLLIFLKTTERKRCRTDSGLGCHTDSHLDAMISVVSHDYPALTIDRHALRVGVCHPFRASCAEQISNLLTCSTPLTEID